MTRLHFDDLTAITAPFGLLDDDTQKRLQVAPYGVELLRANGAWLLPVSSSLFPNLTYRARPAPLVQDIVDWSHVAPPFNWHARDAHGCGHFYTHKPISNISLWLLTDGDIQSSSAHASYRRGTVDWRDSLISRPGVKG